MSKYILFFGLALGIETEVFAQLPAIQTDRPDQTECPFIVPAGHFQMENGFNYERIDRNIRLYALPTSLFRFGINEKFELRIIEEIISESYRKRTITGFTPLTLGFKAKLNEEKGIAPEMAFIGHLSMPEVATFEFQQRYFAPSFRFTMQHTLSEKVSLAYNIGAEWDGFSAEPTFIYTLTTGIAVSSKSSVYFELYGFVPQYQLDEHLFDCGYVYQPSKNIQFDISGGFGINERAPDYFLSLGFSFRLPD